MNEQLINYIAKKTRGNPEKKSVSFYDNLTRFGFERLMS
jgi:hypothetical protein